MRLGANKAGAAGGGGGTTAAEDKKFAASMVEYSRDKVCYYQFLCPYIQAEFLLYQIKFFFSDVFHSNMSAVMHYYFLLNCLVSIYFVFYTISL